MQWHSSTTYTPMHPHNYSYLTSDVHTQCETFQTHAQTNRHPCTQRQMYANTYIQSLPPLPLSTTTHSCTYVPHNTQAQSPQSSSSFDTCRIHTQRCKHFTALRTIAARTTHTEERSTCDKRPLLCSTSDELTRSEMKEEGSLKTN